MKAENKIGGAVERRRLMVGLGARDVVKFNEAAS
jgi:hypothetical protein